MYINMSQEKMYCTLLSILLLYCVPVLRVYSTLFTARRVSQEFYPEPYCSLVQHAPTVCYEASLLELWADQGGLDTRAEVALRSLTQQQVLDMVNTRNHSGIFMVEKDFKKLLGDIRQGKGCSILMLIS